MLLLVELFYSFLWLTLHCLYVPHLLYPFICQWTFKVLPCLSHCKQWHSEHQDTWILSNHVFIWMFVQDWDYWIIHELFLGFLGASILFIVAVPIYIPTVHKGWLFSTCSPTLVYSCIFDNIHINRYEMIPCGFCLHFPSNNVKRLFMYLYANCMPLGKCLFRSSAPFLIILLIFVYWGKQIIYIFGY